MSDFQIITTSETERVTPYERPLPRDGFIQQSLEMGAWTWSAEIGILFGVGAFALIFFPVIAVQYRKYGRFTGLRLVGAGAVSVYVTTLIAYTLLPLPESREAVCTPQLQPVPFHFFADIAAENPGLGLLALLTSRATLQVVFNVVLFVPFGIIVRGFFSRSLPATVALGVGTSVLIEATQYTGIWGIYSCAYRLADVDDLITNTLGALIGALVAPTVLAWMPRERALRALRGVARPVTVWRRWLGMAIDFALFSVLGSVLVVCYRVALLAISGVVPAERGVVEAALGSLVPAILVFVAPAARRTGASLGQTAVWLVPYWGRPVPAWRRLLRAASVGGLYGVLVFASQLPDPIDTAAAASTVLLIVAFFAVPLTRQAAGLSGLIAHATMRDEREPRSPSAETEAKPKPTPPVQN
jgi:glycopeptide antibiotics resistance protein